MSFAKRLAWFILGVALCGIAVSAPTLVYVYKVQPAYHFNERYVPVPFIVVNTQYVPGRCDHVDQITCTYGSVTKTTPINCTFADITWTAMTPEGPANITGRQLSLIPTKDRMGWYNRLHSRELVFKVPPERDHDKESADAMFGMVFSFVGIPCLAAGVVCCLHALEKRAPSPTAYRALDISQPDTPQSATPTGVPLLPLTAAPLYPVLTEGKD
ncbi:Hypothetical protein POVN_LOCUS118 [uncultured virus]|nr:Hypothetical protein POVN_LOCUS118 [uncultured virus]